MEEQLSTVLKFLGGVTPFVIGYLTVKLKLKEKRLTQEKAENNFLKENIFTTKIGMLKELFDFALFQELDALYSQLWAENPIDRITIMFQMNGKVDFQYMTVVFDKSQIHEHVGQNSTYQRLKIDPKYYDLIASLPLSSGVWKKAPFTDVGSIETDLEVENIKNICWFKIRRIALDEYNDLLVYCSCSSERTSDINRLAKRRIEMFMISRIIPKINEILSVPTKSDSRDLIEKIRTN